MNELIQKLLELQDALDEGDRLFAERLGLQRTAWRKVRASHGGLGPKGLAGAVRAFPELRPLVANLLKEEAREILGEELEV